MKKKLLSFAVLVIALAWCIPTFPRLVEHRVGHPVIPQPGWPAGLADLLNDPGRVYGYWINGIDHFYYAGDSEAFNQFAEQYAKLKGTPLTLVVHPGRGREMRLEDRRIRYGWEVRVDGRRSVGEREDRRDVVSVEVWLGGQIELDKMKVPIDVKVESGNEIQELIASHAARVKEADEADIETLPIVLVSATGTSEGGEPAPDTVEPEP